jgi:hypothetical protein
MELCPQRSPKRYQQQTSVGASHPYPAQNSSPIQLLVKALLVNVYMQDCGKETAKPLPDTPL